MPFRKTPFIIAATAIVTILVVIGVLAIFSKLPGLPHPFGSQEQTHVDPQVIQTKIVKQSKFLVEREEFPDGVIITQSNAPQAFARFWHTDSEFRAFGYAPVYVDYSKAITTAGPNNTIIVTLPSPEIGDPYVDPNKSTLKDVRCGLNFFCHPDEQAFFQAAATYFRNYAAQDQALLSKAQADAIEFVTKVATDAGAPRDKVKVAFTPAPTPIPSLSPAEATPTPTATP